MLDESGTQNFLNQFIQPELDCRKAAGKLADKFQIRECRILLPQGRSPIVEFNDEIGWEIDHPGLAPNITMEEGRPIYLHELAELGKVSPPVIDEKRVSFVYIFWNGLRYQTLLDFSPNQPDFDPSTDEFPLGESMAKHIRLRMIELALMAAKNVQPRLRQIGLWPVSSLVPYPISKIAERVGTGNFDDARMLLVEYCDADFIEERLVNTWKPVRVFQDRFQVFQEAMFAHRNRKFRATIYTLVPQVEGVITDWLYENISPEVVKWRPDHKVAQFRQQMRTISQLEWMWRDVIESVSEFLLSGPPLQVFKKWIDVIDPSFPGRHPVTHGKYIEDMFTEENSIKLFLLLDTICQFMMFYDLSKSERN